MDPYWRRLLDIYQSLSDVEDTSNRWWRAYRQIQQEMGVAYKLPHPTPAFDPPAQTSAQYAAQYAEAIQYMMATKSTSLVLPKDFMTRWSKAQSKET